MAVRIVVGGYEDIYVGNKSTAAETALVIREIYYLYGGGLFRSALVNHKTLWIALSPNDVVQQNDTFRRFKSDQQKGIFTTVSLLFFV